MTDARARQPKGIPIGGEFAANAHDEAAALDGFLFTGGDDSVVSSGDAEWNSGGYITAELSDGTEVTIDTGSNYPSYIDPQFQELADGTVRFRYAIPDGDAQYEDFEDGVGEVTAHNSIEERNDFVESKLASGYKPEQVQFVFLFSNGGTHAHESRGTAADENWRDTSYGGGFDVLVVGDPNDESDTDWTQVGAEYMQDRTMWENGDTYQIVQTRVDRGGASVPMPDEHEAEIGIIGSARAEEAVKF